MRETPYAKITYGELFKKYPDWEMPSLETFNFAHKALNVSCSSIEIDIIFQKETFTKD